MFGLHAVIGTDVILSRYRRAFSDRKGFFFLRNYMSDMKTNNFNLIHVLVGAIENDVHLCIRYPLQI